MSAAYFCPLVPLPVVIDEPGPYLTRRGETVTIERHGNGHSFDCSGRYPDGTSERWHKSGRLYSGFECRNDIVAKAEGESA